MSIPYHLGLLRASIPGGSGIRLRKLGRFVVVEPPVPSSTVGVCRVRIPSRGDRRPGPLVPALGTLLSDVEELLAERGIEVDHVRVYRLVQRLTPAVRRAVRPLRHAIGDR
jgi:hypothetical protein